MVNLSGFYVAVVPFIAICAISTTSSPSFTQFVVRDVLENREEKTSCDYANKGILLIKSQLCTLGSKSDLWDDVA